MSILDEKRTHIYLIYIFKFSTFLKTVYIYKSSLKTYINHLQYINYFTTHNLQYITYDTLLTTSCLQWNPTITILFTMETLTEYCITELTLVALSSLIWICLKKFLGVPAKVIECWLNIYIVPFLVKDIYFALLSDVSFFLKEKTLNLVSTNSTCFHKWFAYLLGLWYQKKDVQPLIARKLEFHILESSIYVEL